MDRTKLIANSSGTSFWIGGKVHRIRLGTGREGARLIPVKGVAAFHGNRIKIFPVAYKSRRTRKNPPDPGFN
jgi:hypothetical protein